MKLSNKILIGFLGFLFLYLTAVFAEIRLTGTPNAIDDRNSLAETVDFSGISYLVLNDLDKNVKVIGSDQARLEVRSVAGDLLKTLKYKVSGDTLTLSGLPSEDTRPISIVVFVSKTDFKGISVNASVADVNGLQQNFLNISQNSGRIWMSGNSIGKIQMDLSNRSYLRISDTDLDTLAANIEGSEVFIFSPVGIVQGSIKNKSSLRLSEIQEIQLRKDESSNLNMHQ